MGSLRGKRSVERYPFGVLKSTFSAVRRTEVFNTDLDEMDSNSPSVAGRPLNTTSIRRVELLGTAAQMRW
jgi:hypothetical protein